MKTCSIEGCDGKVLARGWCCKHYNRWQAHGDPTVRHPQYDLSIRLWGRIDKDAPGGCWLWTGSVSRNGYGQISFGGGANRKAKLTHRVVFELTKGPIPDGMDLDHLCRVRHCCNPDHLEPVDRRENLRRGNTIVARNIVKTHCVNGHEFTEANTHRNAKGHRACRACHAERERKRKARLKAS